MLSIFFPKKCIKYACRKINYKTLNAVSISQDNAF